MARCVAPDSLEAASWAPERRLRAERSMPSFAAQVNSAALKSPSIAGSTPCFRGAWFLALQSALKAQLPASSQNKSRTVIHKHTGNIHLVQTGGMLAGNAS